MFLQACVIHSVHRGWVFPCNPALFPQCFPGQRAESPGQGEYILALLKRTVVKSSLGRQGSQSESHKESMG